MSARRIAFCVLFCCTALFAACDSAKYGWSQATTVDTIAAYQTFLSKYPNDPHTVDALSRIAKLQDEQAWTTAQVASTVPGYQQYLAAEPNGVHAQAARDEIATRERTAAWRIALTNQTAQSLQDFLTKYPSGPEAGQARDKLKVIAGYRAELGSARSEQLADRERDALAKRFGKDLSQLVVLQPDANNRGYRIASAPMSEQDANTACASIKRSGGSCTVIQVAG